MAPLHADIRSHLANYLLTSLPAGYLAEPAEKYPNVFPKGLCYKYPKFYHTAIKLTKYSANGLCIANATFLHIEVQVVL